MTKTALLLISTYYFNNSISVQYIDFFLLYSQQINISKNDYKFNIKLLNFTKNENIKYLNYIQKFDNIYNKFNIKFMDDEYLQKLCNYPNKKIKINYIIKDLLSEEFDSKIDNDSINYQNSIINILNNEEEKNCLICLSVIDENNIGITKCSHIFCFTCIYKSLKFNNYCPNCRNIIDYNNIFYISTNKNHIINKKEIVEELGSKISFLINYIKNKTFVIMFSNFEDYINILSELFIQFKINFIILKNKKDLLKLKNIFSNNNKIIILTTYELDFSMKRINNNAKIYFVFLEPYYNIESDIKFKVLLTKLKSVFSPDKRLILNFFVMKNTIENNRIYENIKILN